MFASEAGGDFAMHYSFKVKCAKICTGMLLPVYFLLSKYRFNGVAFFEIVRFSLQKMIFVANIYLSKYAAL